ncbi:Inner membrane ABC transporter permease protein YdcV [compost metagenome]
MAFPPQGFSLKWVAKVFTVESFQESFAISMLLAIGGTAAALVLGVPASYALSRYKLPFGETIRTIVSLPIIVPGIIVGLALLRYIVVPFGLNITLTLFLAHTALVLPYAVRVVSASLNNLRSDIEEAAVLLGSSRAGAFFRVVMPNIRSGILAAFILGFVTSFNQVPVSLFLSGPGVRTLPIDMLSYMEITYDPSIAALSALLAFMSIGIVFLAERFLGFSRYV